MQLSVFVAEKSGETKNTWFKNTNTTRTTTTSWESESRTACCRCVPAKKPEPHPFLLSPKKQRQPSKFCKMQQSCTHWEMTWSHDPRRVGIFLCPVPVTSNQNVSSGGWFLQSVTQKLRLIPLVMFNQTWLSCWPGQRPGKVVELTRSSVVMPQPFIWSWLWNGFSQLVITWPFLL